MTSLFESVQKKTEELEGKIEYNNTGMKVIAEDGTYLILDVNGLSQYDENGNKIDFNISK